MQRAQNCFAREWYYSVNRLTSVAKGRRAGEAEDSGSTGDAIRIHRIKGKEGIFTFTLLKVSRPNAPWWCLRCVSHVSPWPDSSVPLCFDMHSICFAWIWIGTCTLYIICAASLFRRRRSLYPHLSGCDSLSISCRQLLEYADMFVVCETLKWARASVCLHLLLTDPVHYYLHTLVCMHMEHHPCWKAEARRSVWVLRQKTPFCMLSNRMAHNIDSIRFCVNMISIEFGNSHEN